MASCAGIRSFEYFPWSDELLPQKGNASRSGDGGEHWTLVQYFYWTIAPVIAFDFHLHCNMGKQALMGGLAIASANGRWLDGFRRMSQPTQFALAGGLVMLTAMMLAGIVISGIVARTTIDSTAASSALFLDSLLSPLVQDVAHSQELAPESIARLDHTLKHESFSSRFVHVDIWLPDGSVPYSTTIELIGGRFAPPEGAASAFQGNVEARYTDLSAGEHQARGWRTSFLEIYVPLREHLSGRIIAVVEVHETTEPLERKLFWLGTQTWLVVSGATLLIALALIGIVSHSGKLIGEQQVALRNRLREIERVSEQNMQLRRKTQRASARLAEMNESYLRHVGAELHDGPAQLVGLAALKLEHIRRAPDRQRRETALQSTETVLGEALRDVRIIARGLMRPEIDGLTLCEIVRSVAEAHAQRTETAVTVDCPAHSGQVSRALGICVYRFVQEGLNNAYRHAGGNGQAVECLIEGNVLSVRVSDGGGEAIQTEPRDGGLGLTGLRERVDSLGGTFTVRHACGGTTIEMTASLGEGEEA